MKKIIIYTDGACSGNPGPGGWGAIIIDEKGQEHSLYGGEKFTTNNKMELLAVIKALEYLNNEKHEISLYIDSNYVKKGITEWIFSWKKNNWMTASKTAVKNKELWLELDTLSKTQNIEWIWVKSHNGDKYNELVDKLAKLQILK
jgi:ribonuclease HI